MTIETVAVLDACVPVLLTVLPKTIAPFTGFTTTVIGVFNGRFIQLTTTGIGFVCCPEIVASGVNNTPVGFAGTAFPAMLCMARLALCVGAIRIGLYPLDAESLSVPTNW